jgi:hypothetical protein
MSKVVWHPVPVMKNRNNRNGICRVTLEPDLEQEACLLTPEKRLAMAKQFRRWARQLEVSAHIMIADRRRAYAGRRTPSLKAVPKRKLRWN